MLVEVLAQRRHQLASRERIRRASEPVAGAQRRVVDGVEHAGDAEHGAEDSLAG